MTFDIARARRDTPGCDRVLHLNNAGAALMPKPVLDAVVAHLQLESQAGGYEAAEQAQGAVDQVYASIARLIGARPDEIALFDSATRAWDMAFYGIPLAPGDRVLTGVAEYGSNFIAFLQRARQTGVVIDVIPNDEYGQISVPTLRAALDERVKLIALTHVPTNSGLINPAEEVGRVAREAGVLYLLDACQSVGQMPMDVNAIGCDLLSATGRKFLRGPRGTGFLYVRHEILDRLEPPFLDIYSAEWTSSDQYRLRPDARRFESWESSIANQLGLGAAVDYLLGWGVENTWPRIQFLADRLRDGLSELPGVTVQDIGVEKCGIVSFTVDGVDPPTIRKHLAEQSVNVSVSPLTSTRLDMEARGLEQVVRASVHYYNTEEEIERACAALQSLSVC
jgi:cysteine desulfurase / selenocysteine lyase